MANFFYETLQKKDIERCMFIVYSIAKFVASWLKWLQMILNEFKWLQLIY